MLRFRDRQTSGILRLKHRYFSAIDNKMTVVDIADITYFYVIYDLSVIYLLLTYQKLVVYF